MSKQFACRGGFLPVLFGCFGNGEMSLLGGMNGFYGLFVGKANLGRGESLGDTTHRYLVSDIKFGLFGFWFWFLVLVFGYRPFGFNTLRGSGVSYQ